MTKNDLSLWIVAMLHSHGNGMRTVGGFRLAGADIAPEG